MRKKLIATVDGRDVTRQHKTPCSDCPWRRDSLPGWLGSADSDEWVHIAHSTEQEEPCHVLRGALCAGMAIYRKNICKALRRPDAFQLPANRATVFATPFEFKDHHKG